jgi:sensor domain CHASE-containing protein
MTLRTKTLLITGLILGTLLIALSVVLSRVLTSGFAQVEEQLTRQNVNRVQAALNSNTDTLTSILGDWAFWDDTYTFVQPGTAQPVVDGYIKNNLSGDSLGNLRINLMLFINSQGKTVTDASYDLVNHSGVDDGPGTIASQVQAYLKKDPSLVAFKSADDTHIGIIMLADDPALIVAAPILKSDKSGFPKGGALIIARFLEAQAVQELASRTQLDVAVERLDGGLLPPDFQQASDGLRQGGDTVFIRPLGTGCTIGDQTKPDCIAGYTLLADVANKPALVLRVATPRDVNAQAQTTLTVFITSLVGLGIVFTVLTLALLERLVLSPVSSLSKGVARIGSGGNVSLRLPISGSDELAGLAATINQMLDDLQGSLQREKQLNETVTNLKIEIDRVRQNKQVAEITESEFFQDLQAKARQIRSKPTGRHPKATRPKE